MPGCTHLVRNGWGLPYEPVKFVVRASARSGFIFWELSPLTGRLVRYQKENSMREALVELNDPFGEVFRDEPPSPLFSGDLMEPFARRLR
jgi:hypothetical protein